MADQLCKTCRWYNPDFAPLDTEEESLGLCEWPADDLPWSLRYGNRERLAVGPLEGRGCRQWAEAPAPSVVIGTAE